MSNETRHFSNFQTMRFILILCFCCSLILSLVSIGLKKPQQEAMEIYRNKQLLIAARILSYDGYFQMQDNTGRYVKATYDSKNDILTINPNTKKASSKEILGIFAKRITAMLVNEKGDEFTFSSVDMDYNHYLKENQKYGYAQLPYKLVYFVYDRRNGAPIISDPVGYVIPINGYGLWDAIYGYLGLEANGDTILATTWYDQKETPGLGGNISLPSWQKQFENKQIFQLSQNGSLDLGRCNIGIKVVKTTVAEELGSSPKSLSAVDGIAGATVTVNGVTAAYRNSLMPYRNFLIKVHTQHR
ncbi:MAG: NADH:ubiquinone reductase (Na(+)-transporting) subunit C [Chlamydiales bacterium]|nr:NADH:ubiquinone reductase (Na(+)-transporting) subunit C [Chlamydiales bacterium]